MPDTTLERIDEVLNEKSEIAAEAPSVQPYELRAFTMRDVPWGQLGASLDGDPRTATEAAHLGGLDFEVELVDAGFYAPHTPGSARLAWHRVPSQRAVYRKDNGLFMSFVSRDYTPVQYAEAFDFMDGINPHYVAAGTLGGGRQGFMVVQLDEARTANFRINGRLDPHNIYVILRTSHDRTKALEVAVMGLRGRCMNALSLRSFTRSAPQRWSVRHVGESPIAKMRTATETLRNVEHYVDEFKAQGRLLGEIEVEINDARDLLERVLPNRPRRANQVNAIVDAWQHSETNGFTDNGWGLVNAVSEYFEWGRSDGLRTPASRFTSGLNGATARYVNRTAQLLLRQR